MHAARANIDRETPIDGWRSELAAQVSELARSSGALAVAIVGSCAGTQQTPDVWSDLDIVIVVPDGSNHRSRPQWIDTLGSVYGYAVDYHDGTVHHVCFEDLRRLDLIIIEIGNLGALVQTSGLFGNGRLILYAAAPAEELLGRASIPGPQPTAFGDTELSKLAEAFRYKALMAVRKVVRNDMLIASHLALDVVRDCLVLAMVIRDRRSGTNHHHTGGEENAFAVELGHRIDGLSNTAVLRTVEASAYAFDDLALRLSSTYTFGADPLRRAVAEARASLGIAPPAGALGPDR